VKREAIAMIRERPRAELTAADFLRGMSAAASHFGLRRAAPPPGRRKVEHPKPTADTCILLWMAGGMAAPEPLTPSATLPFEVGLRSEKILCTFPAIDTVVDNVKISQGWSTSPRSWTGRR